MLPPEHPDGIHIAFDDHRLVNNAGLILPATLALHLGLPQLVEQRLDLGNAPGRANPGDKMMTLVASAPRFRGGRVWLGATALTTPTCCAPAGQAGTIGERFNSPGLCLPLLRPSPDEGLNRHCGALASVDLHKLGDSGSCSADPVRGLRERDHSAGVIIRRMAGVLKLAKCVDEPLHRRGEQLPILVQVASGIAVVHSAVCSQPGVLAEHVLWCADQAIGVAGDQRVEHGVVRSAYRPADGTS